MRQRQDRLRVQPSDPHEERRCNRRRILTTVAPNRRINEISWSPDGSQLAFTNDNGGLAGASGWVTIINADGTGRHVAVPPSALPGRHPTVLGVDWSPRGDRLAIYVANRGIVIARVDGSNAHRISGQHYDFDPSWSPDGRPPHLGWAPAWQPAS